MELQAIQMEMIMDLKREEWGDKLRLEEVWVGVMGCREEIQGERERSRRWNRSWINSGTHFYV